MSEDDLRRTRLEKAQAAGDAWKVRYDRSHLASELHDGHASLEAGGSSGQKVKVAGRLMTTRQAGPKLAFGDVVDVSGKIQLFVGGAELVAAFDELDTGDIVGASGEVIRTKAGELSVKADEVLLLAKAIRPMPDKWHGLKDTEVRFRQRYLDLIANPEARRIARVRSGVVRSMRAFLDERGFLEVETPMLHPIPGGATALPFVTRHNALDIDMYLRIAPELYLKRLVVGGLERVYEIGRNFRNEGLSYKHNPEFTMLEAYQAYADYGDMMDLFESMLVTVAQEAAGTLDFEVDGKPVSFKGPWKRVSVLEAVSQAVGEEVTLDRTDLADVCRRHGVKPEPWWGPGMCVEGLRDELVEPSITDPVILYDYPIEVSPLARTHRSEPGLAERFEVICAGREFGNAFSELNDPIEQRKRFEAQAELRAKGDAEASPFDEAYVQALEYGLPPTGGLGIGIDRFVMLLTGVHSIREVILFPALRPEAPDD